VIATASRPETQSWCKELGAHHVIDHSKPMAEQLKAASGTASSIISSASRTPTSISTPIADAIAPQGKFGLIDDPKPFEFSKLKGKSASLHWEAMFVRSSFQTPDMVEQHNLLNEVARMVDAGTIRTTVQENLGPINAANLRRAHAMIESGRTRGKIVLAGF
jgi:NADPH2:quinone reductase